MIVSGVRADPQDWIAQERIEGAIVAGDAGHCTAISGLFYCRACSVLSKVGPDCWNCGEPYAHKYRVTWDRPEEEGGSGTYKHWLEDLPKVEPVVELVPA